MNLTTYDPKKQKEVLCGKVYKDGLYREVSSKHFMKVVQGYGIQEIAFQKIMEIGIKRIYLKEKETNKGWQATTETWLDHSKVMDFGHGKQRFLSLKYMQDYKIKK